MIAALPDAFAERMRDAGLDPWRRNEAELVPPRAVAARMPTCCAEALGAHARGHNAYASEMIADALEHCLVYVSWNEILIRPLIPRRPRSTSPSPMRSSASTCQRRSARVASSSGHSVYRGSSVCPCRAGWDKHGSGRRFFLFPNAAHGPAEGDEFVTRAIERAGRALVIAPSYADLERFEATCLPDGIARVGAGQVEEDFAAFTREQRAALLLANRYDGIDLFRRELSG